MHAGLPFVLRNGGSTRISRAAYCGYGATISDARSSAVTLVDFLVLVSEHTVLCCLNTDSGQSKRIRDFRSDRVDDVRWCDWRRCRGRNGPRTVDSQAGLRMLVALRNLSGVPDLRLLFFIFFFIFVSLHFVQLHEK